MPATAHNLKSHRVNSRPLIASCALAVFGMIAFFVFTPASLAGAGKSAKGATNAPVHVWPPPPDEPRIAYVSSFKTAGDFGVKKSFFSKFTGWLTGSKDSELGKPFGIAFDDKGDICFTDTGANVVCWLERSKKILHRWEKIGDVRFVSPVAVAKRGRVIYAVDSSLGCVVVFDEEGRLITEIREGLERPAGLSLVGNRLFVVDSQAHAVLIYDLEGRSVGRFGGRGGGPGEFNFPSHINTDGAGNLYVTDSGNARVQVFDSAGHFVRHVGFLGDGPGCFSRPKGVAVDGYGHLYVLDANFDNIQLFDAQGRLLMAMGEAGNEPGEFWLPNGIAINANNEIYVTDSYNRRIQVFKFIGKP
jgi:DNA-binding beta-propeller fold protein YncE